MDSSYREVFSKEGLSPILKFKTAISVVIANLPLLNDKDYLLATINSFESKVKEALVNSDEFSVFHKLICFKPPNKRTLFELESIKWIFAIGFKFFKLCPAEIQLEIIRRASYKCYGPGRWILKEGHKPKNMYLIVKGYVRVTENMFNQLNKRMEINEHCKLYAKKSFGESALMFNTTRITSVQSLSTLELISISKNDFVDIIEDNLRLHWNTNATAISSLPYFKHLSTMELNKCSTVSFIKMFTQNKYVFGQGLGDLDYGHFVIEGKISLIYQLKILKSIDRYGNLKFKLCNTSEKSNKNKEYMDQYLDTCTYSTNSCFNIGENMEDKEFIAIDIKQTTCLCVPQWFLNKTKKLKNWKFLKLDINYIVPVKDNVFQIFVARQKRKKEITE